MTRLGQVRKVYQAITREELRTIRQSVARACGIKAGELSGINRLERKLKRNPTEYHYYHFITARALQLLKLIRFPEGTFLIERPVRDAILAALAKNDTRFFIRLGRVLSKKPAGFPKMFSELEQFLVEHWAVERDGLPQLFYLTSQGLAETCREALSPNLTDDAVTKTRQRLGLRLFKRRKIGVERSHKGLSFARNWT
jgi:hypothetical protein